MSLFVQKSNIVEDGSDEVSSSGSEVKDSYDSNDDDEEDQNVSENESDAEYEEENEDDDDDDDDDDSDENEEDSDRNSSKNSLIVSHREEFDATSPTIKQMKRIDLLTDAEKSRARTVFAHCSTHPNKELINEEQFNFALTLLGLVEKMEFVRNIFRKEHTECIDCDMFLELLVQLREKNEFGDLLANIQSAFDAIYDGTCELDDQRDDFGRKYIHANELRNLLTTTGQKLSVEEAGQLIREAHPITIKTSEGSSVDIIYFEQYKAMLLDNTV